ncbi:MAG: CPBP family intramembrane glutamic endopeptidase, partial [Nitrosopumilaceae archaeon]
SEGWHNIKSNYLLGMITWFSILIVASVVVDSVQQSFGVLTEPPEFQNKLIKFFLITESPLTEEIGFRMLLIGVPLFAMFATKFSIRSFFKSLWHPSQNLEITNYKKVLGLVIAVGIFFGVAHIISGSPWSAGKFAQATISGIIIGWVYVRHGLAPAILLHWATNYVIFSYIFSMSDINQTSNEASNPFLNTLEVLFLSSGTLAIIIFILNYLKSKKESTALV